MAPPVRLTRAELTLLARWLTAWEVSLPFGATGPMPVQPGTTVADIHAYLVDLRAALKEGPGSAGFGTALEKLRWLVLYYGSPQAKAAAHIDALLEDWRQS